MARRRLDQVVEIVGLDVEGAGIVEHARELAVIELAVDQRHDGEVLHGLARQLRLAAQDRDEVGRLHRRQRPDIQKVAAAQQVACCSQHAGGVGVADRMAAGQRHLAHGAEDGVTLALADLAHLQRDLTRQHQRSGSRMLT
jgi:hypothetical protein